MKNLIILTLILITACGAEEEENTTGSEAEKNQNSYIPNGASNIQAGLNGDQNNNSQINKDQQNQNPNNNGIDFEINQNEKNKKQGSSDPKENPNDNPQNNGNGSSTPPKNNGNATTTSGLGNQPGNSQTNNNTPIIGPGTAVPGNICLEFHALVKDQQGSYCTTCKSGDYITLYGAIKNKCPKPQNYSSLSSCMVKNFSIKNLKYNVITHYPFATCKKGNTSFVVPSNGYERKSRPTGRLSKAKYELEVTFADTNKSKIKINFEVK